MDAFLFDAPDWSSRLSFTAWRDASHRVAAGLHAAGVRYGDRVAVAASGSPVWPVVQTACSHLGAILVPLNVRYRYDELSHVLAMASPRVVFTVETVHTTGLGELIARALGDSAAMVVRLPSPDVAVDVEPGAAGELGLSPTWSQFLAHAATLPVPAQANDPSDPVLLQFTSGTTALPKGALLSSAATLGAAFHLADRMGLTTVDTVFSTQPFYHVGGTVATTLIAITHQCSMVVPERYRTDEVFRLVPLRGCTARTGQAAMYAMELADPAFSSEIFAGVRKGWAVGTPQLLRAIRERMGILDVIPIYGLTEAAGISTAGSWRDAPESRETSSGPVLPGVEIGVSDGWQVRTELGVSGEVCIRGWSLMAGYYGDPEATAAAIDADGWLHTGDLGHLDERGCLHFEDRLKDMIKPGGENVSTAEVERVIAGFDGVERVAVVGMPDSRLGEVPAAFVQLRPGSGLDESRIVARCAELMASFKVPARVLEITDWPVTESGKVQKHRLRERFAARGTEGPVGRSG